MRLRSSTPPRRRSAPRPRPSPSRSSRSRATSRRSRSAAPGTGTDAAGGVTVYGATSLENQYIIDGVNTTGIKLGNQGKTLNQEFVQEVEVKTGGYEAEYGRALGGVINVVTKSGGNEFHGDAFGYYDPRASPRPTHTRRPRRPRASPRLAIPAER